MEIIEISTIIAALVTVAGAIVLIVNAIQWLLRRSRPKGYVFHRLEEKGLVGFSALDRLTDGYISNNWSVEDVISGDFRQDHAMCVIQEEAFESALKYFAELGLPIPIKAELYVPNDGGSLTVMQFARHLKAKVGRATYSSELYTILNPASV